MPQDRGPQGQGRAGAASRAATARDDRRPMPGVPEAAAWLGLSGLIPFGLGAAGTLLLSGEPGALTRDLLAGYGAVILSFMGGCRWGFAAAGLGREALPGDARGARREWLRYGVSVIPALFAWPVLWLDDPLRLGLLAVGFVVLLSADVTLAERGGAPAWWPVLRRPLSWGAAGCLGLAAVFA
ncbi:MAG: DUF3429 domain-containing protein [Paracoccaceae bacterium]